MENGDNTLLKKSIMSFSSSKKKADAQGFKKYLKDLKSFLDELMISSVSLQKLNKLLIHLFLPTEIAFWTQMASSFYLSDFSPHDSLILLLVPRKY